jgi:hypothetical protein
MILLRAEVDGEDRQAWFSEDELYRYALDIVWDPTLPLMTAICLNPSTATHLVNDPTIVKCKKFARAWGYGGFRMLNAFAYRSSSPAHLFHVKDPVGPENSLVFLKSMATELTLAGWGVTIQSKQWRHWYRGHDIAAVLPNLKAFRITDGGHPEHPLFLPLALEPVPFCYSMS